LGKLQGVVNFYECLNFSLLVRETLIGVSRDEQATRPIKFRRRVRVLFLAKGQKLIARSGLSVLSKFCGQATKGAWWMPWQKQAMKDVASCDKPRGAASRL
jgi:hypothetical protein